MAKYISVHSVSVVAGMRRTLSFKNYRVQLKRNNDVPIGSNSRTMFRFQRCETCGKPIVNEHNVKILRKIAFAAMCGTAALTAPILPLLGFGLSGIAAGSVAAAWQAAIGSVAAGSVFAILQSLGATGLGILLFGTTGAAIGLLTTHAFVFGFCNGH